MQWPAADDDTECQSRSFLAGEKLACLQRLENRIPAAMLRNAVLVCAQQSQCVREPGAGVATLQPRRRILTQLPIIAPARSLARAQQASFLYGRADLSINPAPAKVPPRRQPRRAGTHTMPCCIAWVATLVLP